jgi:hypothetical protein
MRELAYWPFACVRMVKELPSPGLRYPASLAFFGTHSARTPFWFLRGVGRAAPRPNVLTCAACRAVTLSIRTVAVNLTGH